MNLHDRRALVLADILEQSDRFAGFWDYVDNGQPDQREEWAVLRDGCMAITTSGWRCTKAPIRTMPFCPTHVERAERWIEAVMIGRIRSNANADLRHFDKIADDASRVIRQAVDIIRTSEHSGVVYFWELVGQGLVKIGTSRHVKTRTAQFLTGRGCTFPPNCDPSRGHLIGTVPGDRDLESHLHRAYRRYRVTGEWFQLSDEVADGIADLLGESEETAA